MLADNEFIPHYRRGGSMDHVLGEGIFVILQGLWCWTGGLEDAR